jgi:hypothetical protein
MKNKPKSFVSGKDATGAQKPKQLMTKVKVAILPAKTKSSMNMGKGKQDCK